MDQLARRAPPPDLPKYGYLLEYDGALVGAILLIFAEMPAGGSLVPRCNLSSWYVEPEFRTYAPLLVSHALRHKEVTYLNVSAAPHTWPIIEAQGFARYSEGVFVCIPALKDMFGGSKVAVFDAHQRPTVHSDVFEQEMLERHIAHGCISLGAKPRTVPIPSFSARAWSRPSYPARN